MRRDYIIPFAVAVLLAMLTWSTAVAANAGESTTNIQDIQKVYPSGVESIIDRR